jgi:beta-glucosidase
MVLLANKDQMLPLTKDKVQGKKIALIGFAKGAMTNGGGSAGVNAHYKVTPWDAFHNALGDNVQFTYAKGAHKQRLLAPISKDSKCGTVVGLDSKPDFTRLLYDISDTSKSTSELHGYENSVYSPLGSQEAMNKMLEIIGDFTPNESGAHYIACSGIGSTEIFIDGKRVYQQEGNCQDQMGALFSSMSGKSSSLNSRPGPSTGYASEATRPTTLVSESWKAEQVSAWDFLLIRNTMRTW